EIPDEDVWAARQSLRTYLFQFVRERARKHWTVEQSNAACVVAGGAQRGSRALTIGFARRFTGYKRPELVFRDAERLARLVSDRRPPAQFVFFRKEHAAAEAREHQ